MKQQGLGQPIPAEKIEGLRSALERDHRVRFKNGSQVEYEDCERCRGEGKLPPVRVNSAEVAPAKTCPTCGGEKVRVLVTRPAGGVARYRLDTELVSAYAMALRGPQPRQQPSGDGSKFGDEVPW